MRTCIEVGRKEDSECYDTSSKSSAKDKEEDSAKEEDASDDAVFWTRVEKLYGQKRNALRWLDHTVPVKNMATGYGYITVVDAATHTGC